MNLAAQELKQSDFPFPLARYGFKYLGVHIASSFKALRAANFNPFVSYARVAFQRWVNLPVSLLGRNNVKINFLPKFLYLLYPSVLI